MFIILTVMMVLSVYAYVKTLESIHIKYIQFIIKTKSLLSDTEYSQSPSPMWEFSTFEIQCSSP